MERPQHSALFEQAISDCARMYFGGEQIPEGAALDLAIADAMATHEAWITGAPFAAPADDATDAQRAAHFRAVQMRRRFEAEPMMFGTPADQGD